MKKTYRFISDDEPTEKQLADLMLDVARSVKERAKLADIKIQENFKALIRAARERKHIYEKKLNDA